MLVGKVNKVSHSHIGLLVAETFNAAINHKALPRGYSFAAGSKCWSALRFNRFFVPFSGTASRALDPKTLGPPNLGGSSPAIASSIIGTHAHSRLREACRWASPRAPPAPDPPCGREQGGRTPSLTTPL